MQQTETKMKKKNKYMFFYFALFLIPFILTSCDDDDQEGHVYNIVLYQGSYRIMDYNILGSFFDSSTYRNTNGAAVYRPLNLCNDRMGEVGRIHRGDSNYVDPATYTYNYPSGTGCPAGGWTDQTYYTDV
mgnify:FL=1